MLDIVLILLAINTIVAIVNRDYLNLSIILPPFGFSKYFFEKKNIENETPIDYLIASMKGLSFYYIIYCMIVGIWGDNYILSWGFVAIPTIDLYILTCLLLGIAVLLIIEFTSNYYLKHFNCNTILRYSLLIIEGAIFSWLWMLSFLELDGKFGGEEIINWMRDIIGPIGTIEIVNTGLYSFYILLLLSLALITIFILKKNWKKAIIYILLTSIIPINVYYNVIDIYSLSNLGIVITPILILLAILFFVIPNIYQSISHWPHNKSKIIKAIIYSGSIGSILILTYYLSDGSVINSWQKIGVTTFVSKSVTTGLIMVVILSITSIFLIAWGTISYSINQLNNNPELKNSINNGK